MTKDEATLRAQEFIRAKYGVAPSATLVFQTTGELLRRAEMDDRFQETFSTITPEQLDWMRDKWIGYFPKLWLGDTFDLPCLCVAVDPTSGDVKEV
jgi:hypothetical protein